VSIVGPAWSDADLAQYADQLHRRLSPHYGIHCASLPNAAPKPGEGPVLLAVVGAHLRGQPLHWQLADRTARFVGRARTDAHYRLYALDSAPPKPGLVRDPDFSGDGIEVEIFSLDFEAFGSFVANVPPPLAIGTVHLEDGSSVKGFICESAALSSACEITGFGGWRAYLSDRSAPRAQASA
jgi:allophanate hydrolase